MRGIQEVVGKGRMARELAIEAVELQASGSEDGEKSEPGAWGPRLICNDELEDESREGEWEGAHFRSFFPAEAEEVGLLPRVRATEKAPTDRGSARELVVP